MCGRFLLDADYEALIERYQIFEDIQGIYEKKIEIFPSNRVWAIIESGQQQKLLSLIWGITATIRQREKQIINGRWETFDSKPFFKHFMPCLIPASGYYEWHRVTKAKYVIKGESALISFAGLYDPRQGRVLILTCDATPELAGIHERMPVIVPPEESKRWLNERKLEEGPHAYAPQWYTENLSDVEQLSFFNN
ncbi:SOS response-associated peptidase family protein [Fusibacter paucivorans]|uniref:Abasic site processing protein n=1 Tax=Fusibacter paucivorans TaxID=76009 RepID=A0ABS5PQ41_9FIRM|nr:SOS response-associated peptidase family protein [Fusibacter paucivorans]MBS7527293.1 SOS response-associated peptidase family protein [Fusibacter paucivorans]